MSPLARSLLALAAVLAVATALYPPSPNCADKDIGRPGTSDIPLTTVNVSCPYGDVDPGYWCESPKYGVRTTCGEYVHACNPDPYGPPPSIWTDEGTIRPVHIRCNDPRERYATVQMTVHCCPRY